MTAALTELRPQAIHSASEHTLAARQRRAAHDVGEGLALWRLCLTLGWLDIRLRYRGSLLGPFWLTASTAVMVASMGVLYSSLFQMNLREYLPFLALSLVLWGGLSSLVTSACTCFVQADPSVRSLRLPFTLHAGRVVVRDMITLAHNVVVIVAVYAIFEMWPGWTALLAAPAILLWIVDAMAAALLFGALCARFRDIPPIVGSVMQIMFFVTPVIWKPQLVGENAQFLPFNPFYGLIEIVRGPLLAELPSAATYASALGYSAALIAVAWLFFARVRGRIAFWV